MKKGKSCGCLIATNVVHLEIEKRRKKMEIERLRNSIKKIKDRNKILKLRKKEKELLAGLKTAHKYKTAMKQKFSDYVKKSGYVPPKR